ncbi:protein FAR1-RELATED SEQUENCE 9-like [Olea europaea var. sylvestris]|uniref:protein FAR1-RELATED SEQUENCE 9-like n=1 Tax=Olea europaea var. sylvestris TaxID=158386 RepID=UPI000C1D8C55|nr:protein FAR1-RELATED SEQUENCE 9-like [Olea europaea var. sylvestris]
MNTFFDGYVHSKTSLKQFVERYERALCSKVEKEFQADFKSFSQTLPRTTQYEMEQQFQSVYTIFKFKEAQAEFTGKVYYDLISTSKGHSRMMYEVRKDVMRNGIWRKKTFFFSFDRQNCDIVCSCHLFKFRGIIYRHAIAVLIHCDIILLHERYILQRWKKDVGREHTRIAVNYDELVSTLEQLRYDDMCCAFEEVTDLAAEDEGRVPVIMEWIKLQRQDLMMSKKSCIGSHAISNNSFEIMDQCTDYQHHDLELLGI